jgi:hypothetical protein
MQDRCPHCEKPIKMGTIICPSCNSYVIKVEDKKRVWHLYAIPGLVLAIAIGLGIYLQHMNKQAEEKQNAPVVRKVDPNVTKQLEAEDAERRRIVERRERLEARRREEAEKKAVEARWRSTPRDEQIAYVKGQVASAQEKIVPYREMVTSYSGEEFNEWVNTSDSQIAAAAALLDADRVDQAKGIIDGVMKEFQELEAQQEEEEKPAESEGEAEEGEKTAEPAKAG